MLDPNNSRQSLVQKDPMIILKNLKTTTAIVECGFLSNPEEEKKLVQEEYQDRIAAAIAEGINEYFGI
jgi:N-acetylmuramoyl-L-alanine amidase